MALGDAKGKSSGNGNKLFENTYYSRVGFKDYENKLRLGFNFKSGMLVVDLSKEKEGFAYDTLLGVFVTPTKSKILLAEIAAFEKYLEEGGCDPERGFGINSGMGEIVSVLILHVNEDGKKTITLGKVDGNGKYTEKYDYVFATDFHYGLNWNNINNMDCEKVFNNDVEFEMFVETIKQFSISSNGAMAYSVADLTRYDTRAILNKMNPIFDKLGIDRSRGGNGNSGSSNNFFNRNESRNGGSSQHKSYDELEDGLPFDDED